MYASSYIVREKHFAFDSVYEIWGGSFISVCCNVAKTFDKLKSSLARTYRPRGLDIHSDSDLVHIAEIEMYVVPCPCSVLCEKCKYIEVCLYENWLLEGQQV